MGKIVEATLRILGAGALLGLGNSEAQPSRTPIRVPILSLPPVTRYSRRRAAGGEEVPTVRVYRAGNSALSRAHGVTRETVQIAIL